MSKDKESLNKVVIALVGVELAPKWWDSPNKAFEGKTPNEIYEENPKKVKNYLLWHATCGGGS